MNIDENKNSTEYLSIEYTLLDLFNFWYNLKYIPTIKSREEVLNTKNLPFIHLRKQWDEVWFAKGEKQKFIDKELLKFESIVNKYMTHYDKNNPLFEKMALIVLYDQIPRNVYRGTSKAYDFDKISRQISLDLIEDIDKLPIHFKFTVLICLCHSENLEHQTRIRKYIYDNFVDAKENKEFKEIFNTLTKISDNHYSRVAKFGRIVERNKYVGRVNTEEENIFLSNLK